MKKYYGYQPKPDELEKYEAGKICRSCGIEITQLVGGRAVCQKCYDAANAQADLHDYQQRTGRP